MKVLFPSNDLAHAVGELPHGVEVAVWEGVGSLPEAHRDTEFLVLPYPATKDSIVALTQLPGLRVCQALTAGVEQMLAVVPSGAVLCNARGSADPSTAELVVGLILASVRGIPEAVAARSDQRWVHRTSPTLLGRRVLIVGYGSVATALERRLVGFDVDIVRVARSARSGEPAVHATSELPTLLPSADVVVLLLPMTDETRGMVDKAFLSRMADGALLVNAARGPIVDTDALVAELRSGRLLAALDVTDPEPLPVDHPLWWTPGTLITPHLGGDTTDFYPRVYAFVRDQIDRYLSGESLANVITGTY
jgi:phosphoglycerate dehydrogenase-like enzyme